MRAFVTLSVAGCVAVGIVVVTAQGFAASERADRYDLTPVEGGFLRVDHDTGLTAFCAAQGEGYACRPATERDRQAAGPRAATPGAPASPEIARLEQRIAALEATVKTLGPALPPVPPLPPADGPAASSPSLELPTDRQLDEIAAFFERALKRFKKFADDMDKAETPDSQRL